MTPGPSTPAVGAAPSVRDTWVASLLALTAGATDTVGFIALFGLFTAHVTGNFVVLGATLAQARPGVAAKLLALPTFIVAVALTRLLERAWAAAPDTARRLLAIEAALLVAFLVAGVAASPIRDGDTLATLAVGLIGVTAMAVQNAASRTVFASLSPTTVMTGNVTQLTLDMVDLIAGHAPDLRAATVARFRKMWPPVLWFAIGAAGSGLAYGTLGFLTLLGPLAAVIAVAALWRPRP